MIKELAKAFLDIADSKSELITAYINGSNDPECVKAYNDVIKANQAFINAWNNKYSENREASLDYELAEYCID